MMDVENWVRGQLQRVVGWSDLNALVRLVNNRVLIVGRVVDKFGTVHSD